MTTFDAPRGRPAPTPPRPAMPGGAARGGPGRGAPHRPAPLFDERGFEWPELPGNPKREAKIPWFHFQDVHEARNYLRAVAVVETIGIVAFVNWLVVKNELFGQLMLPVVIAAQVVFRRIWVRLCKRASPPLGKYHWLMTGWGSLPQWQCISQARAVVRDR